MTKAEFLKEHEIYGDIDLLPNEQNKLHGLPMPGATVHIYWQNQNGSHLCIDVGYLFLLPFQDEGIDDYFIHCPKPDNPDGKDSVESEWAHINKLLKNSFVEKIIVVQNNN